MFQCSIGPLVHWSIGPLIYLCIGLLVHWFIGPLVECQMSKVNKVKFLSEHTSGVPPVIFLIRGRGVTETETLLCKLKTKSASL